MGTVRRPLRGNVRCGVGFFRPCDKAVSHRPKRRSNPGVGDGSASTGAGVGDNSATTAPGVGDRFTSTGAGVGEGSESAGSAVGDGSTSDWLPAIPATVGDGALVATTGAASSAGGCWQPATARHNARNGAPKFAICLCFANDSVLNRSTTTVTKRGFPSIPREPRQSVRATAYPGICAGRRSTGATQANRGG